MNITILHPDVLWNIVSSITVREKDAARCVCRIWNVQFGGTIEMQVFKNNLNRVDLNRKSIRDQNKRKVEISVEVKESLRKRLNF